MPHISIIIPIYKAEKYLDRCINSVINQSYRNFELILVNDGSPDSSLNICRTWANKDSRIKVMEQENLGANASRLNGYRVAKGEYLCFVDADDTMPLNALEKLYREISKGYDVVKGNYMTVNSFGQCKYSALLISEITNTTCYIQKMLENELLPFLWGGLYRKSLFDEDIFNLSIRNKIVIGEDWITNIGIATKVKKFLQIKEVVYEYYVNSASTMNTSITSSDYMERTMNIVSGLVASNEVEHIIRRKLVFGYILNSFIPELKFSVSRYKKVTDYLTDLSNAQIVKKNIDKKYLLFISFLPLYFIAEALKQQTDDKAEQQDEHEDFQRVAQCRHKNAARFLMFLVAVDVVGMALVAAVEGVRQNVAQRDVQQPAAHDGKRHLAGQQQHERDPLGRLRRQQRDGLVAGRDEHRQQRTGRDDPACVQVGGHRTEAALRHTAQQRTGDEPPAPAACEGPLDALTVMAFEPLDQQVGQIQKRQHFHAVDQCVQKCV